MNRLEKKCFLAAAGMHLFLFLLVVFGAAFFVSHDKTATLPPLKVVPTKLIDDALSGGGGNPKAAPSDAQQHGDTLVPQPVQPPPQLLPAQPPARPVAPTPEVKQPVEKPKPLKPPKDLVKEPVKPTKDVAKESVKPPPVPKPKVTKPDEIVLTPATRPTIDKAKEKADAEAKAAAAETKAAEAAAATARKNAAKAFARAADALKTGYSKGTAVDIQGPGGEAYANYDQWVKEHYDNAWIISPDLANDDSTALVRVTIARSGRVINAELIRNSGNSSLDRSVRRTLDKVKFIAPFPAGAREEERTYTIEFNLKAKRLLG